MTKDYSGKWLKWKQKAKRQRDYEKTLLQTAQKLQQQAESLTPDKIDEYEKVKRKLEAISFKRTRGACVQSKARWHEFGERSSKYFLNLEKRNFSNKCINKLIDGDNKMMTEPKAILEEQKKYYQNLYSSQNPNVQDPIFSPFFENEDIKKLEGCMRRFTDNRGVLLFSKRISKEQITRHGRVNCGILLLFLG